MIAEYGAKQNYTLVLEASNTGAVLYGSRAVDITDPVIQEYNTKRRRVALGRSEGHRLGATLLEYRDIVRRLPHRYPFLFIDRVVELVDGERVVAIKNVSANEPFFRGHFPGRPIMPGVLVCEALVQAGGLLACCSTDGVPEGRGVVLVGLEHVRFRRPVDPGRSAAARGRAAAQAPAAVEDEGPSGGRR